MLKKSLFFVLILISALVLFTTGCKDDPPAETTKDITISGKVIWGGTVNAVANATVKVGIASTKTAANGTFQLKVSIPVAGLSGTLTVNHPQCVSFSQSIGATGDLVVSDILVIRLNHVDAENGDDATADGTGYSRS